MRKTLSVFVLVLVVVFFGCGGESEEAAQEVVAKILSITNSLDYRESEATEWKMASVNQELMNGWQVRATENCRGVVVYPETGNRVLMNSNTEFEVQVVDGEASTRVERTRLIAGEVYSRIQTGTNYQVETPTTQASVRGTEFNTAFIDGKTSILVTEGTVGVANELGEVVLEQNQGIEVVEGEAPSTDMIQQYTPEEIQNMTQWAAEIEEIAPVEEPEEQPEEDQIQDEGEAPAEESEEEAAEEEAAVDEEPAEAEEAAAEEEAAPAEEEAAVEEEAAPADDEQPAEEAAVEEEAAPAVEDATADEAAAPAEEETAPAEEQAKPKPAPKK